MVTVYSVIKHVFSKNKTEKKTYPTELHAKQAMEKILKEITSVKGVEKSSIAYSLSIPETEDASDPHMVFITHRKHEEDGELYGFVRREIEQI